MVTPNSQGILRTAMQQTAWTLEDLIRLAGVIALISERDAAVLHKAMLTLENDLQKAMYPGRQEDW